MTQARRKLSGFPRRVSTALAVALACFTFYTAAAGVFLPMIQRGVHLCVVIALVFLWYPARRNSPREAPSWLDVCCCALSLLILSWVLYSHERLLVRIPFYSKMEDADIMSALTMTLLVLEAARRTVGWPLVLTALAFILYALLGPWAPGVLMHGGMTLTRFCDQVFLTTEGFFSSLVGSSATILYCFVAFGAFLQLTGADRAYMNICLALTGRARGGAAKVSILSSMLFGSISGSTIANVVSTGTLTIPLMKRTGYLPHEAAAVETAASSAGQIMPPIMGTCAFIMADLASVRYGDIVSISYIPAVMYFASLWFIVHKIACMRGFSGCGEESLPALRRSLLRAIPVFLPVLLLVAMMLFNFTPFLSGSLCTVLLAFIGLFFDPVDASATGSGRGIFRYSFSEFLHTLERCAVNMCSITATVACATLVVAMVNKTGLMLKSTSLMLSIAGTSWEMNLLCLAVMAYVIGMGLPTSSAYVLLAALGAPVRASPHDGAPGHSVVHPAFDHHAPRLHDGLRRGEHCGVRSHADGLCLIKNGDGVLLYPSLLRLLPPAFRRSAPSLWGWGAAPGRRFFHGQRA